jgi:hypothetical protein
MIYTAPCVMFLMRTDTLYGQVGGDWALEIERFLGPVKWHLADRGVPFGGQNSYLWTYDLYCPVHNAFDVGKSITWTSGRGVGPGNQDFFGPCDIASSRQASAIWDPKKSRFPGPNPLPPTCPINGFACIKSITRRTIDSFMNRSGPLCPLRFFCFVGSLR